MALCNTRLPSICELPCVLIIPILNFRSPSYDEPPLFDVSIEEFETCALDRLRILAEIESSAARNRSWDELKDVTSKQCRKYLPLNYTSDKRTEFDAERRRDHLSHFVLRLAFCRSYVLEVFRL